MIFVIVAAAIAWLGLGVFALAINHVGNRGSARDMEAKH